MLHHSLLPASHSFQLHFPHVDRILVVDNTYRWWFLLTLLVPPRTPPRPAAAAAAVSPGFNTAPIAINGALLLPDDTKADEPAERIHRVEGAQSAVYFPDYAETFSVRTVESNQGTLLLPFLPNTHDNECSGP